ncbi:hypothetical protein, partial [Helicobacter sp.]|uniref:hypothetical protein n=1 Tax=Helicobacter sp. TaxID=218 RepID=UPI0025BB7E54
MAFKGGLNFKVHSLIFADFFHFISNHFVFKWKNFDLKWRFLAMPPRTCFCLVVERNIGIIAPPPAD